MFSLSVTSAPNDPAQWSQVADCGGHSVQPIPNHFGLLFCSFVLSLVCTGGRSGVLMLSQSGIRMKCVYMCRVLRAAVTCWSQVLSHYSANSDFEACNNGLTNCSWKGVESDDRLQIVKFNVWSSSSLNSNQCQRWRSFSIQEEGFLYGSDSGWTIAMTKISDKNGPNDGESTCLRLKAWLYVLRFALCSLTNRSSNQ